MFYGRFGKTHQDTCYNEFYGRFQLRGNGTESSGEIKILMDLDEPIEGKMFLL